MRGVRGDARRQAGQPLDEIVAVVPGGGKRQAGQRRQRFRPGFAQNGRAVVLDGALADAALPGDRLVELTREHPFHDLALPRGEAGEPKRGLFATGERLGQGRRFGLLTRRTLGSVTRLSNVFSRSRERALMARDGVVGRVVEWHGARSEVCAGLKNFTVHNGSLLCSIGYRDVTFSGNFAS
jgi:hypothetical protein